MPDDIFRFCSGVIVVADGRQLAFAFFSVDDGLFTVDNKYYTLIASNGREMS